MVSFEFLAVILTGLGLIVSILYYTTVIQNANKTQNMQLDTRQAQLFMNIYTQFISKEFSEDWIEVTFHREWDSLEDYIEKYGQDNLKAAAQSVSVFAFFEGVGVLLKRNLIDISMVDDLMSSYVLLTWRKYGPLMRERSEASNRPELWEHVHYLYDKIKQTYKEQHGHNFQNP